MDNRTKMDRGGISNGYGVSYGSDKVSIFFFLINLRPRKRYFDTLRVKNSLLQSYIMFIVRLSAQPVYRYFLLKYVNI